MRDTRVDKWKARGVGMETVDAQVGGGLCGCDRLVLGLGRWQGSTGISDTVERHRHYSYVGYITISYRYQGCSSH